MSSERFDRLTHKYILKEAEPGRHGDGRGGNGLSILITERPGGRITRTWSQRVRINGRTTNVGSGSFPAVTLAMARAKAADNARKIAQGEDIRKAPPKARPSTKSSIRWSPLAHAKSQRKKR